MKSFLSFILLVTLLLFGATSCDEETVITTDPNIVNGIDTTVTTDDFLFASKFIAVGGNQIHYVDEGAGAHTFVLVHGIPMSNYLWRNVIPHLATQGRVIAPDLLGFGESDQPAIDYTWFEQTESFAGFMDALDLDNVILVTHDWGLIAHTYAAANPEKIAGMVVLESATAPFPEDLQGIPPENQFIFQVANTGEANDPDPNSGWELLVRQNFFVDQFIENAMFAPISDKMWAAYRAPFAEEQNRKVIWSSIRAVPFGENSDPAIRASWNTFAQFFVTTEVPQLVIHGEPGQVYTPEVAQFVASSMKNSTVKSIGTALHFYQEDQPHRLGIAITEWYQEQF